MSCTTGYKMEIRFFFITLIYLSIKNNQIDGNWTQFSFVWQPCTVTCGGGIQSGQERRTCTNPSPFGNGKPCEGSIYGQRASRSCNTHPCPVNGNWSEFGPYSEWGICSVTCGTGIEKRYKKRECDNPKPQHGGQYCTGTSIYTDNRVCNLSPCPVNGGWSEFVPYGDWSQCSVSCSEGVQTRVLFRTCSEPEPLYGGKPCEGRSNKIENKQCRRQGCPVHGGWSEYGPYMNWSDCSVTCGGGVQQGVRVCKYPEPENGMDNCIGSKENKQERICNSQPCPVNGQWSSYVPYGDWSQCSSSCNNGTKTRVRIRTCSQPAPLNGGKQCVGQSMSMETMTCNLKMCVVNGHWSSFVPYGDWSQCSSSCNNGTRTRVTIRTCSQPAPLNGGKQCVGQRTSTETTTCNIQPCSEQAFFSRTSTVIIIAVVSTILVFLVPTLIFLYCRRKKSSKLAPPTQTQSEIYEEIHNMNIMSNHYVPSYAEYILHPMLINRNHPNATVQPLLINIERMGSTISNRINEYRLSEIPAQGDGDQTNRESLLCLKNSSETDDENETKLAICSGVKAEITSDDTELRNFTSDGVFVDEYQKPMFKRRNSYITVLPDESMKVDETVIEEHHDYLECFYDSEESVKCREIDSKLPNGSHFDECLNNIGDVA